PEGNTFSPSVLGIIQAAKVFPWAEMGRDITAALQRWDLAFWEKESRWELERLLFVLQYLSPGKGAEPFFAEAHSESMPFIDCRLLTDVERMRLAIRDTTEKDGIHKSPDALQEYATMNRQRCRKALRYLAANDEYNGFSREKPDRYRPRDGSPPTP